MPRFGWIFARTLLVAALPLAGSPALASEAAGIPERVGFNEHIRPILVQHCVGCHGGPKQASGVTFLHREGALAAGDSGERPVVPGDVAASYLVERISDPDDDFRMPPADHGPRLTEREVDLIKKWIEQGAAWEEHWSLVKPTTAQEPKVELATWPLKPVDRFILRRLEQEGLQPAPPATRQAWLRRVTFDLIGLPPTAKEASDFLADNRPDAYERVVDRLLASPHFGERWASLWLDLARYSDTMGYEKDPHRDIWPYRDWLIRALNSDMPYDEFTIKQLAGDLLQGATLEDRIATAFHRNTPTNTEGGTDDEEFRTAAVLDRVNTTWQAWMGSTYGCAQCHDHPYDAFRNEDYYAFAAFFNTSRDSDVHEDLPKLATPTDPADYARADQLDNQIAKLEEQIHEPLAELASDHGQWLPLTLDRVDSTGSTRLKFVENDGAGELVASGTITYNSRYTLAGPAPELKSPVTALRIEALPYDLQQAARNPNIGFILSKLKLEVIAPGKEPREVFFADAFCDEPHPQFDPSDSLRDNPNGWAEYSRIYGPRWAVFLLDQPLELPANARLKFKLKQERNLDGQGALVLRRARFAVSTDSQWDQLTTTGQQRKLRDRLAELNRERSEIETVAMPVMVEQTPKARRRTFFFERGNWLDKGEEVQPGTPASMPDLSVAEGSETASRLDMARWIASPENPLTSRTMVNRVWGQLFGIGLVETEEDLGGAGEEPSHPELLDYLAVKFAGDYRWSLKTLLHELVLSAAYRQDARVTPELLEHDPRNRLLARGPRLRLSAEMVRDQALVLSGKFSDKLYGEPVMPYQPAGIWQSVYSAAKWEEAKGEDRFRRALYTYWKRTSAYPSLVSFDMPSREVCTVRRIVTNTPLQALVTMNDPAYIELAQGFADRIAGQGEGAELTDKMRWAYRTATGKRPHAMSVAELEDLYHDARARFEADPEACKALADDAETFALVIVANAVMNLDDALTR